MPPGLAARLLQARDEAAGAPPARRTLALLAAAEPDAPPEALLALPVGEGDRRLLALRRTLLGDTAAALADCPACGTACELDLPLPRLTLPAARSAEVALDREGWHLHARLPTLADLLALASATDPRAALLARCLLRAEHEGVPVAAAALPPELVVALAAALAEADPQADIELELACPACGAAALLPFDIGGLLWRELERWADALLLEVDALARAYGWSEAAILALPAARRRRYLELAGA